MHRKPLKSLAALGLMSVLITGGVHAKSDWKKIGDGLKQVKELSDELHLGRENEENLGKEVAAYLIARHGLLQDEDRTRYISLVGLTLARGAKRDIPYKFGILDTDAVNAYATPGGRIFVTAGLLDKLSNEAQLAGVLAHEIIHVDEKHTIKGFVKAKALGAIGKKISKKSEFDDLVKKLIEGIANRGFPKADEYKADLHSLALMEASGYNRHGLSSALTKLYGKRKETLNQSFHSRHPSLKSRLHKLKRHLKDVPEKEGQILGRRYRGNLR